MYEDYSFRYKLALCMPTYNRCEVVQDFLERCADNYTSAGIDIYIFDSSDNDNTKIVVEKWNQHSSYQINYIHMSSDIHPNVKVLKIFEKFGSNDLYDFIWLSGDAIQYSHNGIKQIISSLDIKYDILDIYYKDCENIGKKEYSDCNEFLKDCAWELTLFGASILNTNTMLKNINWEELIFNSCKEDIVNFSHVSFYYNQILQVENFLALRLPVNTCDFTSSFYKKESGWVNNTFEIFCVSWLKTIEGLPSVYDPSKSIAIKKHGRYVMLRNPHDFYLLKKRNIYNFKVFLKYRKQLPKVSDVPLFKLMLVAITPIKLLKAVFYCGKESSEKKIKKLIDFCRAHDNLYIYGAGKVGFEMANFLLKHQQAFKAFCVTNSSGNLSTMLDRPIYSIDNLSESQKKDAYFIISIGKNRLNNVFDTLAQYGFNTDNVYYDQEFIDRLLTGEIE